MMEGNVADSEVLHFTLPRSDYEIAHESWHVMGLKGTGSKDLIVKDAFVPFHRVIHTETTTAGMGGLEAGREGTLYSIPRNLLFQGCITTATLALAQGCVDASANFVKKNPHVRASTDPYQLAALGEAFADLEASKLQLFTDTERVYERLEKGATLTFSDRAAYRRNQVRRSRRAVDAADAVFKLSGGAQLQSKLPMQRFWRDAQAALHHISNQDKAMYQAWGLDYFGHEAPTYVKI
jgi:3-hydroxy-9,10-secoandrosta-1,3,5(10)-triene-9,17-dione monooxygenase